MLLPAQLGKSHTLSKNFERGQKDPSKGLERPMKEVKTKDNNYWYNNNLQLKVKV